MSEQVEVSVGHSTPLHSTTHQVTAQCLVNDGKASERRTSGSDRGLRAEGSVTSPFRDMTGRTRRRPLGCPMHWFCRPSPSSFLSRSSSWADVSPCRRLLHAADSRWWREITSRRSSQSERSASFSNSSRASSSLCWRRTLSLAGRRRPWLTCYSRRASRRGRRRPAALSAHRTRRLAATCQVDDADTRFVVVHITESHEACPSIGIGVRQAGRVFGGWPICAVAGGSGSGNRSSVNRDTPLMSPIVHEAPV
jgi:hypothetical protein